MVKNSWNNRRFSLIFTFLSEKTIFVSFTPPLIIIQSWNLKGKGNQHLHESNQRNNRKSKNFTRNKNCILNIIIPVWNLVRCLFKNRYPDETNPVILMISDENQDKQNGESNQHIDVWRGSNSEEKPKLDNNRDRILISTDGHHTTITPTGKFSFN